MTISEAVARALKENKSITRSSLQDLGFEVLPTDSSDCCYIVSTDKKQKPARCWNPTANDLVADDWELVIRGINLETKSAVRAEGGEKMLESPRNRINGTDEFMVQRSAARILEEMQKSGWTQGEAELLPKYLESAIKQNSERIRKLKPFAICEITKESL